jgi:hypothetical protein
MAKPAKQLIDEILATLTEAELTQINKLIEHLKELYLKDVPVDYEELKIPIDCENDGFCISELNAKQRLYLAQKGYKIKCRYIPSTKNQRSWVDMFLFLY